MNKRRLPDDVFRGIKRRPEVKTYRLFLGIFPPENYVNTFRQVIREYDKEKRNLKLIPMDQIHLTLKFIGSSVSENSKNIIVDALTKHEGKFPKPPVVINKVQFGFPYQNDPRVIMLRTEDSKDMAELTEMVHVIVRDLRLLDTIRWREKNSAEFHFSLARLKDSATRSTGKDVSEITRKIDFAAPEPFIPEYIELVESLLTRQGIVYKRLARIRL